MSRSETLIVFPDGTARWGARTTRTALGSAGVGPDKREGDGRTPVGRFPMRSFLWRPDRLSRPASALPSRPILPDDGWCDDPNSPDYNRPIKLPHPAGHEVLTRDDHLYDLVVIIGHNDDPPAPGLGSAVFLHLARPDWGPTRGCVAFSLEDLVFVVEKAGPGTVVDIRGRADDERLYRGVERETTVNIW